MSTRWIAPRQQRRRHWRLPCRRRRPDVGWRASAPNLAAPEDVAEQVAPVGPPDALIVLPLLLIAVITVADVATPSGVRFDPMLAAAPALAAAICGVLGTGVIALLALAVHVTLAASHGRLSAPSGLVDLLALVGVALASLLAAWVRRRRERQLGSVRSVALAAQRALLRPMPAQLGTLRVAVSYLAAQADARIGGDLYDAAHTPFGDRILVGDVLGKGLASVDSAAALLGAFREAAYQEAGLTGLARRLEESVLRQAARSSGGDVFAERFVTALLVQVNGAEERAWVISRGHPPPLLLRGRQVRLIEPATVAPPLGLGSLDGGRTEPESFEFGVGDVLLLYTDGVTEARNSAGVFFPLVERATAVAATASPDPVELLDRLRADLLAHAGGRLADDAAMVAVARPRASQPQPETASESSP